MYMRKYISTFIYILFFIVFANILNKKKLAYEIYLKNKTMFYNLN